MSNKALWALLILVTLYAVVATTFDVQYYLAAQQRDNAQTKELKASLEEVRDAILKLKIGVEQGITCDQFVSLAEQMSFQVEKHSEALTAWHDDLAKLGELNGAVTYFWEMPEVEQESVSDLKYWSDAERTLYISRGTLLWHEPTPHTDDEGHVRYTGARAYTEHGLQKVAEQCRILLQEIR